MSGRPTGRILVSACLLGDPVRWNGRARPAAHPALERWRAEGRLVPVCPELLAGFPVPRPAAETRGGDGAAVLDGAARVVESTGRDATEAFLLGAERALELARARGCRYALLTDGSPSCGSRTVFDGSFGGTRVPGAGVAAALLERNGVSVFAETGIGALAALVDGEREEEGA